MPGGASLARILTITSLTLTLCALALLPDRAAAGGSWHIVLDRPTPNFGAVDFVSETEGWMPAGAGLLHTTDGGATWDEQARISGNVDFYDRQHGWAVGLSGAIYGTSDGGHHWQLQTSGTQVHLGNVDAVGPNEAWLVGTGIGFSDVIMPPPHPSDLLHTTNGGATWESIPPATNVTYREVAAVGDNVWVLAERCELRPDYGYCEYEPTPDTFIQRSRDGGATWTELALPAGNISRLTFASEHSGWLVEFGCTYPDCIPTSAIHWTANGGDTWERVDTSAYGTIAGLSFEDAMRGWALATSCRSGDCVDNLLYTENGGATWLQQTTAARDPNLYGESLVAHHGTLFVTSLSGTAMRSSDGGRSWEGMDTPAIDFGRIDFVDADTGFASSRAGLFVTDNAGKDWRFLTTMPASASVIEFLDPALGFAGSYTCNAYPCGPEVVRTTDGGLGWTTVLNEEPLEEEGGITQLQFVDRLHGLAATQKRIFLTSDGGERWREATRRAEMSAYFNTAVLAGSDIWAHTQTCPPPVTHCNFGLVRSSDGGATWEQVRTLTDSSSWLQFVDREHGWYVDQVCLDAFNCELALFATSDGGATWDRFELPGYPWDLVFTDLDNGWINTQVCEQQCQGIVLHTTDGGHTWEEELSDPLLTGDLDFADADNGWLALSPNRGQGIGGGPPQRTVLYHYSDDAGFPDIPDVGAGPVQTSAPLLPLVLGAMAALAFAASLAVRRGAYPSTKSPS